MVLRNVLMLCFSMSLDESFSFFLIVSNGEDPQVQKIINYHKHVGAVNSNLQGQVQSSKRKSEDPE